MNQDWTKVVIRGAEPVKITAKPTTITTHYTPQAQAARKLAEAEDAGKPKTLADRQELVNRRVAKSWSQTELNQQCRFPVNTIREIEAGRLCPSIQQLNTLNRVLKCGLKYA